ncbi:MAG: hypothetical protein HC805_00355 [Alkalinema sp. RL_2_19]|nr:hypothetical protein [Alkalinema sp. RL_2_19]
MIERKDAASIAQIGNALSIVGLTQAFRVLRAVDCDAFGMAIQKMVQELQLLDSGNCMVQQNWYSKSLETDHRSRKISGFCARSGAKDIIAPDIHGDELGLQPIN